MSDSEGVSRRDFLRTATAGAAVAGGTGTAAAQEGTSTDGEGGGGGGGGSVTVSLVDYAYEPGTEDPLYIAPGTTVNFVWETPTHNIVVDSQPSGAGWSGYEAVEGAGFEYSHTFETLGTYEFHCQPHANLGMAGTIIVNESGQAPGGGGYQTILPDSATTLGVAATGASVSVLALAYFFMKYGGDYGDMTEE